MSGWIEAEVVTASLELEAICRDHLRSRYEEFRTGDIRASFYPYLGLTHTIRRKGPCWFIRISDHCLGAPEVVLTAVVSLLACRILRRPPPREILEVYDRFKRDPEIQRRVERRRAERGRKRIQDPRGRVHSLEEIFEELNRDFFNSQIEVRQLGWGPHRSWRRLAHYDPLHQTITMSPVLDSSKVPRSVIACILYHEMLHVVFDRPSDGKRRFHPPEFRRAEKAYPGYAEAKKFLHRFCRSRGRAERRKAGPGA